MQTIVACDKTELQNDANQSLLQLFSSNSSRLYKNYVDIVNCIPFNINGEETCTVVCTGLWMHPMGDLHPMWTCTLWGHAPYEDMHSMGTYTLWGHAPLWGYVPYGMSPRGCIDVAQHSAKEVTV